MIVALAISVFQYFYKAKRGFKKNLLFAFFRFIGVFLLLLLLINPKVEKVIEKIVKPELVLLADQSQSIAFLKKNKTLDSIIHQVQNDKAITNKFDVYTYAFGASLKDSLNNKADGQTNLNNALEQLEDLHKNSNTVIVPITDGNQTLGVDYSYFKFKNNQIVNPVILGDTTKVQDLIVSKVNSNKYTYLNNKFPVEVLLNYKGSKSVKSQIQILNNNKLVYKEDVSFNANNKSKFISTEIKTTKAGLQTYQVFLKPFNEESNTKNNSKFFSVEALDKATNVLIVSSVSHPDIAALKRSIETNKQRKVKVVKPKQVANLDDVQLLIAYQPNMLFKKIYNDAYLSNTPILTITGVKTDWDFVNSLNLPFSKQALSRNQEVLPVLNNNFELFKTDVFDFKHFPPLDSQFGDEILTADFNVLLKKKIAGITTQIPLVAVWESEDVNQAVVFGEGMYKWRLYDYKEFLSFDNFDTFTGKLVQFLTLKDQRKRLILDYESVYYLDNDIKISATYFNKNYELEEGASLAIKIFKNKAVVKSIPMNVQNGFYIADLSDFKEGDYTFVVSVNEGNINASGAFTVLDFNIEEQFSNANFNALDKLSKINNGTVYFPSQTETLLSGLIDNQNLKPIVKSKTKQVPLISWKYLLALILIVFAIEWFIRKYNGLI